MAASSSSSACQPTASAKLRTANDATVFNSSASQPTANAELRIANNGIAYSRAEFEDFYGRNWERKWSEALRSNGHEEGQRGCAPQPTVTNTTSTDTTQLTSAQLEDRQPANGVGGKLAWAKQKELREKAMEQHGSLDNPTLVPSSDQSDPMGGASQPANGPPCRQVRDSTYKVEDCAVVAKLDMLVPNPPGPVVGRREAHTACITLLQRCAGVQKCAIDITDEQAFPWRRWLINIAEARQTLAVNVVRVFIVRWDCDAEPCIIMCREDSTYACIWPSAQRYTTVTDLEVHTDWPSLQILRHPWYVTADWLKVRANAA